MGSNNVQTNRITLYGKMIQWYNYFCLHFLLHLDNLVWQAFGKIVELNGTLVFVEDSPGSGVNAESLVIGPIRLWHVCGMVLVFVMAIIITLCCCVDVRIPRKRQEIDEGYQQRKLNNKYGERFVEFRRDKLISNLNHPDTRRNIEQSTMSSKKLANQNTAPLSNQPSDILNRHRGLRPSQVAVIRTLASFPKSKVSKKNTERVID